MLVERRIASTPLPETYMVKVSYDELETAFEFVSSAGPFENQAFIDLDSGAIYWKSDNSDDDDLPDDLEDSDRYLAVPHKHDLDLGQALVFRFASERMPRDYDTIRGIFHRKGAYARFKQLLESNGRLDEWYRFEADATVQALKEWCAEHSLEVV
jgi:hypothetical protein